MYGSLKEAFSLSLSCRCFSSYDDMSLKRRVSCPLVRSKSFQMPATDGNESLMSSHEQLSHAHAHARSTSMTYWDTHFYIFKQTFTFHYDFQCPHTFKHTHTHTHTHLHTHSHTYTFTLMARWNYWQRRRFWSGNEFQ